MPTWAAWLGWIATFIFGIVTMLQFIRDLINRQVQESQEGHVEALANTLADLRHICRHC